jgi:uncharacterized damage-inducible protein DinB
LVCPPKLDTKTAYYFFRQKRVYTRFLAKPSSIHFAQKEQIMILPTLQAQFGTSFGFLQKNLQGFDSQNASNTPTQGGNSAAWLLSHIVAARQLPLVFSGAQPIWNQETMQRWGRSPAPLEGHETPDWNQLCSDLNKSQDVLMAHLATLEASDLERQTPAGTLGSTIAFLATHEAYHVGQVAMLRRALGMPGVMA